jgi:hypothetical protein
MLGALLLFLAQKRLRYFAFFTGLVIICSGLQLGEARKPNQFLVLYHAPGATVLGFISGTQATLLADSAFYANPKNQQYAVQPHWGKLGITATEFDTLNIIGLKPSPVTSAYAVSDLPDGNKLLSWRGKKIMLCLKPLRQYNLASLDLDYLVLTNNVYFTSGALPNKTKRPAVILTSANNNWYLRRMMNELTQVDFPVHNIKEQGAVIIPVPYR